MCVYNIIYRNPPPPPSHTLTREQCKKRKRRTRATQYYNDKYVYLYCYCVKAYPVYGNNLEEPADVKSANFVFNIWRKFLFTNTYPSWPLCCVSDDVHTEEVFENVPSRSKGVEKVTKS